MNIFCLLFFYENFSKNTLLQLFFQIQIQGGINNFLLFTIFILIFKRGQQPLPQQQQTLTVQKNQAGKFNPVKFVKPKFTKEEFWKLKMLSYLFDKDNQVLNHFNQLIQRLQLNHQDLKPKILQCIKLQEIWIQLELFKQILLNFQINQSKNW
ncbi:unnamed protein product [Paramecium pentaurelia]|uniref:Transmembrane protein n=1 Tax=Paramecium pentaurelia TaxID=43138 RepID=A0A8S1WZ37_9CILI|nr:unnamed protein product [Paramecium pentaurelia]